MLTNLSARSTSVHSASSQSAHGEPCDYDVVLAPLSGITDRPFRRLVRSFGTAIVFSEMVASGELLRGSAESFMRAQSAGEGLHAVQLAGRDPHVMGEAARRLVEAGADLIDINMGCPAKKVVGGASGAALMQDLDLARSIIASTVRGAAGVPVSVKMRLGWSRTSLNAATLADIARAEGACRVTLHGRTRDQFYEGRADWDAIGAVAATAPLPVTANGDLTCPTQLAEMRRRSRCRSVMIGRGACGRPWLPALAAGRIDPLSLARIDLGALVSDHYEAMLAHYGSAIGLRHARKHLGWYAEHLVRLDARLANERPDLLRETDAHLVARRIRRLFDGLTVADVEDVAPLDKVA